MSPQSSDTTLTPWAAAGTATVLLVDDEPSVTRGIQLSLHRTKLHILAAHSAASALELLRARTVDVVVSDECMPGMRGTEFLALVRAQFPAVARILLTGHATVDVATKAINEGQIAFLLQKPCPPDRLHEAIVHALARHRGSEPASASPGYSKESVARGFPRDDFARLSAREKEILYLVVDGQRPGQIAKSLFISEHTARNHLKVIFRKLDAHSQSELMARGRTVSPTPTK
jgi:DNA-binding NarL/FixJ family response regulator